MVKSACIGFCRSSDNKELGQKINEYLYGKISEFELKNYCKKVRLHNIQVQKEHNVDIITSNDFAMYDHMLDATCLVGNIQKRYYWEGGKIPLDIYFSLSNGVQKDKFDVMPLELRNWLNTNYLYHVHEFVDPIEFAYSDNKPIVEYLDAKSIGVETSSTIIAPISYLLQGKMMENNIQVMDLLEEILPVYKELFANYIRVGVKSINLEDPMICNCIDRDMKDKYTYCYNELRKYAQNMEINLITYYGSLRENFDFISSLPINTIHIDVPYNQNHITDFIDKTRKDIKISLGVIDSRSVWKNDLNNTLNLVSKFCNKIGTENIIVSTSSPLFLCPYSIEKEQNLDPKLKKYLSFAVEKLDELNIIKTAINSGRTSVSEELNENKKLFTSHKIYSFSLNYNGGNNGDKNYKHKWNEFTDKYNLQQNPMFFLGNAKKEFQADQHIDISSSIFTNKNYDISNYADCSTGMYVCQNNFIPRFGAEYYNPTIIYDYPNINDDIFTQCIKSTKSQNNKPLKFAVCSPLHFINFSLVSPFLDKEKLLEKIFAQLVKCIKKVSKSVDLLQIDEFTINSNIAINDNLNIDYIKNYCALLNKFISSLRSDIKYIAYCSSFCDIKDFIEYLCKMNIDLFVTTSVRSRYDILNSFISYKPEIPVAFGMMDPYSKRVTTKNEMLLSIKKIFSCIDKKNVVFTTDGDFGERHSEENISKSINSIYSALKEIVKEIEKEKKNNKTHEKDNNKPQKEHKKKTAKSKTQKDQKK